MSVVRWSRRGRSVLISALLLTIVGFASVGARPTASPAQNTASDSQHAADEEQRARAACATCHPLAPPDVLPRGMWRDVFVRMLLIRENRPPPSGPPGTAARMILLPPDMQEALSYYLKRAPERLPAPERWPPPAPSGVAFVRRTLSVEGLPPTPAVSNVRLAPSPDGRTLVVLATDMRHGLILKGQPAGSAPTVLDVIGKVGNPAQVRTTDLDADGTPDLLVADLGTFLPADHDKGAVYALRGIGNDKYAMLALRGWPRVADVEAADFNGDGRPDLAVAAFGWRTTGMLSVLENRTADRSQEPSFSAHTIDTRTGSLNAVPVDLNGDGHVDLVSIFAQQHETVVAYLNRGTRDFAFEPRTLYTAPHANWGSSGIQVADLDRDGDLDVLLTHGDTFDDGLVKPYHGIQWLENTGTYPFVEHTLVGMPGVHRAQLADLDGDGDLDVIACALFAGGAEGGEEGLPALVWLEQTGRGVFTRHTLETGFPRHATLDVGDIEGDGDLDIIVGNFATDRPIRGSVDVWESQRSQRRRPGAAPRDEE